MEEILNSKFYITTPIYYVNDVPHIGHAYTTIIADTLARYHRIQNEEVWFLTGTDEHGQKIQQSAEKNNKNPKEYVDEISAKFKNLWDSFGISYDAFIRTTDSYHKESVRNVFSKMFKKEIFTKANTKEIIASLVNHFLQNLNSSITKIVLIVARKQIS